MVLFGDHASNTTAWHPEPAGRGTYSILSACLVTMGLCIYSAIHLNIPVKGKEHLQKYKKIGWVFMGLFAPELVAFNAWEQRKKAAEHCAKMRKLLGQSDLDSRSSRTSSFVKRIFGGRNHKLQDAELSSMVSNESSDHASDESSVRDSHDQDVGQSTPRLALRHQWTMTHSFYTIMGGFAIQLKKDDGIVDKFRGILSPYKLLWLAEIFPNLVLDLSVNEIRDKSKASSLAKAIVCGETLWFCIQCVARFGSGLSVTLLELNVFSHALCALAVYSLWWDKPLDIETPTVDEREFCRALSALLQTALPHSYSHISGKTRVEWYSEPSKPIDLEASLEWQDVSNESIIDNEDPPRYLQLRARERLYGFYFEDSYHAVPPRDQSAPRDQSSLTVKITEEQVRQLKVASYLASTTAQSFFIPCWLTRDCPAYSNWNLDVEDILDISELNTLRPWGLWAAFTVAGALFGGIHLCSWTVPLPTQQEIALWRISAIMIMAAGPLFWLAAAMLTITDCYTYCYSWSRFAEYIRTYNPYWLKGLHYIACAIAVTWFFLYVAARVYIIVAAFIAMAYLPPSALETPTWTKYLWHLVG